MAEDALSAIRRNIAAREAELRKQFSVMRRVRSGSLAHQVHKRRADRLVTEISALKAATHYNKPIAQLTQDLGKQQGTVQRLGQIAQRLGGRKREIATLALHAETRRLNEMLAAAKMRVAQATPGLTPPLPVQAHTPSASAPLAAAAPAPEPVKVLPFPFRFPASPVAPDISPSENSSPEVAAFPPSDSAPSSAASADLEEGVAEESPSLEDVSSNVFEFDFTPSSNTEFELGTAVDTETDETPWYRKPLALLGAGMLIGLLLRKD